MTIGEVAQKYGVSWTLVLSEFVKSVDSKLRNEGVAETMEAELDAWMVGIDQKPGGLMGKIPDKNNAYARMSVQERSALGLDLSSERPMPGRPDLVIEKSADA